MPSSFYYRRCPLYSLASVSFVCNAVFSRGASRSRLASVFVRSCKKTISLKSSPSQASRSSVGSIQKSHFSDSHSVSSSTVSPLFEFYENGVALPEWNAQNRRVYGRAWRAAELRCKSFDDLHQVWMILVKELNVLATQKAEARRQRKEFMGDHRVHKCRLSMARIKQVLSERQRLYKAAVLAWKRSQMQACQQQVTQDDLIVEHVERLVRRHKMRDRGYRRLRRYLEKRQGIFQ